MLDQDSERPNDVPETGFISAFYMGVQPLAFTMAVNVQMAPLAKRNRTISSDPLVAAFEWFGWNLRIVQRVNMRGFRWW